jgi:hypothetical protein
MRYEQANYYEPQSAYQPLLSSSCITNPRCNPSLYTFRIVCWQRDILTSRIDWPMLLLSVFSRQGPSRCADYMTVPRSGTARTWEFGFESLSEYGYAMFGSTMSRANTLTKQYYQTSKRAVLSIISEALTPVVMKSSIFCDMQQCNLLEVNRRLGGTCRLHLQGRRIFQARN